MGLYVLERLYSSLHSPLQQRLLKKLDKLSALLVDRYTAVRHAAARVLTTLAKHNTVSFGVVTEYTWCSGLGCGCCAGGWGFKSKF